MPDINLQKIRGDVSEVEFPVETVTFDKQELESTSKTPGVVSVDDWLEAYDRKKRRTVVRAPGGFDYPQLQFEQSDIDRIGQRTAEIRAAVLLETEDELAAARVAVAAAIAQYARNAAEQDPAGQ